MDTVNISEINEETHTTDIANGDTPSANNLPQTNISVFLDAKESKKDKKDKKEGKKDKKENKKKKEKKLSKGNILIGKNLSYNIIYHLY